jgi:hypothetical protein
MMGHTKEWRESYTEPSKFNQINNGFKKNVSMYLSNRHDITQQYITMRLELWCLMPLSTIYHNGVRVMVFNATFNNISQ